MERTHLIDLIRGLGALEARGDGVSRPMGETKAAVTAFRNAMIARLIGCHLSGQELAIDTDSLVGLHDAIAILEREGDGFMVGLSTDHRRMAADVRAALVERVRSHPGGATIARLMARQGPPVVLEAVRVAPAAAEVRSDKLDTLVRVIERPAAPETAPAVPETKVVTAEPAPTSAEAPTFALAGQDATTPAIPAHDDPPAQPAAQAQDAAAGPQKPVAA